MEEVKFEGLENVCLLLPLISRKGGEGALFNISRAALQSGNLHTATKAWLAVRQQQGSMPEGAQDFPQ